MNKKGIIARVALFATAIIWGTSFFILKSALDNIGTFWILALRFSIATVIFTVAGFKSLSKIDRETLISGAVSGFFLTLAYIVQTFGLAMTTPGKNAFLSGIYCVLVPFMVWVIYGHKPRLHNVIAAFLCLGGIAFVSLNEGFDNINMGDILTVLSGIFYAMQIVVVDRVIDKVDSAAFTTVEFAASAVICWIGALFTEAVPTGVEVRCWLEIVYLGITCTGIGFFLETWGMKHTPAATTAMIMSLESVFGALFSVLFFGDRMTVHLYIGFAMIFVSVIMSEVGFEPIEKLIDKIKGD